MKWNNRSYRPGNYAITQQKKVVDISELLKPYDGSNKGGVWIPVQQVVANVPQPSSGAPDVTPTPTPTTTLTSTPTPTTTLTSTPTPSTTTTLTPTPTTTTTLTPTPTPSAVAYDSDAVAYLNAVVSNGATGMTSTISAATNTLFTSLKSNGLYTGMTAFYPMIGGVSASHKLNAKNPLDTNAAYRIVFNGGWTHSATGALPNGVNAYGDTFCVLGTFPPIQATQNNTHISYYSRTNSNGAQYVEMGIIDNNNNASLIIAPKFDNAGNALNYRAVNCGIQGPDNTVVNTAAYFIVSRINGTQMKQFRNGSVLITDNTNSVTVSPGSLILGSTANYGGGPVYYSNRECAFASIGRGLSDSEASTLDTIVQTFQTSLSRNV